MPYDLLNWHADQLTKQIWIEHSREVALHCYLTQKSVMIVPFSADVKELIANYLETFEKDSLIRHKKE